MQLRHSVPYGTTGLTRWAPTGWPPSTPMKNIASSAVLQKAGFVYDHDVTDRKFDGTPVPCRAYHLLKEEL